ncbi:unnamed protein product [Brassica oleracea var. botrytis]|uniref:F-box domain-containing protein n=2 Tax=Brassica TaxID=3705 RepID=A0A0D3DGV6_BRAOL|nr:unnamed protein product [Brassica napus]CDY46710.1 BnaC07g42150D [Brassica napus]
MISGRVEPTKKKKKNTVREPPSVFSSLPDEIVENILARVSRWKYPSLSLVSKRFHTVLSSMEIYKTRSQIGASETCSYVLLKLPDHPSASWFSLRPKPNNQNRTKRWFSLETKPNNQNRTKRRGKIKFKRDSWFGHLHNRWTLRGTVRIFDCRSHTSRDAPNMTVARENARSALLDEKIYVMGGCDIDKYNANWIEVFDLKTQSWTSLPGKLYLEADAKEYSYEPKNGAWKLVREMSSAISDSIEVSCEIGNLKYGCTGSGHLMWSGFENEGIEWREIKGLEELQGLKTGTDFGLVGCGGQLLVMWDPYTVSPFKRSNKIRYAEISLESRRNGREMWGKVECVDVLTFPVESYKWFDCVAASV